MKVKNCLTSQETAEMMRACREEAARNHWAVSVAIVDDSGNLLQLERLDGAGGQTPELATLKAATSALSRFPTKTVEDMLKDRPAIMTFPRRAPVQGGLPITYRGEVVGAIGVSGMRPHEDEQIAQAGIQHFQTLSA
jgi:glc operon protein GlcG